MRNNRIFIGNLNFEVTEEEVRNLLSKYGSVNSVRMHQKKGYAFVEMGNEEEALKAIKKLDGVKYRDREIRINIEIKAGKAKSLSVRKYQEKGKILSKQKSGATQEKKSGNDKYHGQLKSDSKDREKKLFPEYRESHEIHGGNSKPLDSEIKKVKSSNKDRPGLPRPERDRWATEKPVDNYRSQNRNLNYNREKVDSEKSEDAGNRSIRDYAKGKPSYPAKSSNSGAKAEFENRKYSTKSSEKFYGQDSKHKKEYSSDKSKIIKKEWKTEKPLHSSLKTNDRKINDRWKEKPGERETLTDRGHSRTRSSGSSLNRYSKSSRNKTGSRSVTATASHGPEGKRDRKIKP